MEQNWWQVEFTSTSLAHLWQRVWTELFFLGVSGFVRSYFGVGGSGGGEGNQHNVSPVCITAASLLACYCDTSWNNTYRMWDATIQPQKLQENCRRCSSGTQRWYLYNTESIFVLTNTKCVSETQDSKQQRQHTNIYINIVWLRLCRCKNKTKEKMKNPEHFLFTC